MSRRRDLLRFSSLALTAAVAGCTIPDRENGSGADEEAGIVWDRRYEGARATRFLDIVSASAGGFLLVGFTTSNIGATGRGFAIRTDSEGREQWRHTVSESSALLAATEGANGEFVATTYRATGSGGTGDSGAVALSDDGAERWRTPLSQSGRSQLWTVVRVSDESYVLGGTDREAGWLVWLEPDGSVRANRQPVLESVPIGAVTELHSSASGLTVLASGGEGGTESEWGALFQLVSDGSVEWGRRYDQQFSDMVATDDGYALLGRETRPNPQPRSSVPPRPQLVVVSTDGEVTDSRAYGPSDDVHWFIEQGLVRAPDGGFIVGGRYEPWEDLGTRRGPIAMQTNPDVDSVAWARLYEGDGQVWALARADSYSVFTGTVDEERRARLVQFGQPQTSNVSLEATTLPGPTSEPL